jgi:predicted AAA+ superfamily ATPase
VFQEPLCLIKNEADGSFSIEEDVLNQISQIDRTVNVIAIAGPYRSGKSYLMNRLARNKHGKMIFYNELISNTCDNYDF